MQEDLVDLNKELLRFRKNYYRDNFRRSLKYLIFLVLVNLVLVLVVGYLYISSPHSPQAFYASNSYNGVNTKLTPLSEPLVQPGQLLDWTADIIKDACTFNFVNYRDVFANSQKAFTDKGWSNFNDALKNIGLIDRIINNQLFMYAEIINTPKIIANGVVDGHYAWTLQMPLIIYLKNKNQTIPPTQMNTTIRVVVTRIPNLDNPAEIAIDSFSML